MANRKIFVLNGPNLNLLGQREPELYGTTTLCDIETGLRQRAEQNGFTLAFHQTNAEGTLVDQVHEAMAHGAGLIINPGAYTHTSIALRDALLALSIPIIEVHLSNIHAREAFRQTSHVSPVATGVICGLGAQGYARAFDALCALIP
ncbi:MAG: type II 3-dehydroquinate dehydratase [Pseudomonadota bacterium]